MARRLVVALAVLAALALGGCAGTIMRNPVPEAYAETAVVPDLPHVRYWGDALPPHLQEAVALRRHQIATTRPYLLSGGRPIAFLALSGGGSNGAFGAGFLAGWTAAGTRPQFEVVTGISTGGLIAPFAFLGPKYDPVLERLYTTYRTSELVTPQILAGLFGGIAITETSKFKELIDEFVTDEVLAEIAAEHSKGRRLLIGTTNLDAERPVIWDMGAIAASRHPGAKQLFRDVLLATASIPGVFPPVFINVEAAGGLHDEMHVDGGTTAEVFFLSEAVLKAGGRGIVSSDRELYVITNGKSGPTYEPVKPTTFAIAKRSLSTLILSQWNGDVARLQSHAEAAGIGFNIAAIPPGFDAKSSEPFDPDYMAGLYQVGYELARSGYSWSHGLQPGMLSAAE
ncbi:MAG: patatin-like phospholipase family protein [Hyphomicrobiaceae bacterium]